MDKSLVKQARRGMNQLSLTVLVYLALVNIVAIWVMIVEMIVYLVKLLIQGQPLDLIALMEHASQRLIEGGWSYIVAIVIGVLIVCFWKGRGYWKKEVFEKKNPMTAGNFFQLLCVFLSVQLVFMLVVNVMEWLLNLMGFTAMAAIDLASSTSTTFSMFLYAGILGPISEELLFRGVVLRTVRPWGKQTAIVVSALVFALFHGNVAQIPFAFAVGLVLGYVTAEYSIIWAIALHVINNLVIVDLIGRLPLEVSVIVSNTVIIGAAVVALVLLIVRRRQVAEFFRENRCSGVALRGFFTSPAAIVLMVLMLGTCLLTITPL